MFFGKFLRTGAIAATVLAGLQLDAAADPITYEGTLTANVSQPGALGPGFGVGDARGAGYWLFWATAGDSVTVIVERVDGALDPAQFVYDGVYAFTTDTGLTNGTDDLFQGTNLIVFGDDERSAAVPGPFGDPESAFMASLTGWYTVAVGSFLSDSVPNDGDYDYAITVRGNTGSNGSTDNNGNHNTDSTDDNNNPGNPVPEPALLALLTCGACGVTLSRRRKSA